MIDEKLTRQSVPPKNLGRRPPFGVDPLVHRCEVSLAPDELVTRAVLALPATHQGNALRARQRWVGNVLVERAHRLSANDTGIQLRAGEGAQRPTHASGCNPGLGSVQVQDRSPFSRTRRRTNPASFSSRA